MSECAGCPATFVRTTAHAKYCADCVAKSVYSPSVIRTCKGCAAEFPAKGARQRIYCAECAAATVWIKGKRRANPCGGLNIRQRIKKFGVEHERVVKLKVYERDGWQCGLCPEPVDPTLAYPHPMSASLDHVVPISRGGGHTYANTQCSHLECNVRKGARSEQLAITG
jgi:5-methylcytosine-specific restriction endonuclease McrA